MSTAVHSPLLGTEKTLFLAFARPHARELSQEGTAGLLRRLRMDEFLLVRIRTDGDHQSHAFERTEHDRFVAFLAEQSANIASCWAFAQEDRDRALDCV
jgi:hypothetical protein